MHHKILQGKLPSILKLAGGLKGIGERCNVTAVQIVSALVSVEGGTLSSYLEPPGSPGNQIPGPGQRFGSIKPSQEDVQAVEDVTGSTNAAWGDRLPGNYMKSLPP